MYVLMPFQIVPVTSLTLGIQFLLHKAHRHVEEDVQVRPGKSELAEFCVENPFPEFFAPGFVIDFGAFVDIGVHQDGLVHISQMSNRFIKHPMEVVSVGDIVDVQVLSVDVKEQKIQLTMKIQQEK